MWTDGSFVCNGIIGNLLTSTSQEKSYEFKITGKLSGKIEKGQKIFKVPEVISSTELNELFKNLVPIKKTLNVKVSGKLGEKLKATFILVNDENTYYEVSVLSESELLTAEKRSLNDEVLNEKFGKLGGTDFILNKLDSSKLDEGLFLPLPQLNEMKRKAIEELESKCERSEIIQNPIPLLSVDSINPISRGIEFVELKDAGNIQTNNSNKVFALKLPLVFSEEAGLEEEYLSYLENNSKLIPYFQAILFENEFSIAVNFLEKLSTNNNRAIIVENLGLGKVATDLGFKIVREHV